MQVGQQVVCIDDSFPKPLLKYLKELPVKGKTYTVRAVFLARGAMHCAPGQHDGELGILLQELTNPPDPRHLGRSEIGFNASRFKPLDEIEAATEEDHLVSELAGTPLPWENK